MGWHSQQYGSFERFLVALAHSCDRSGLESHFVFPAAPASHAFVCDASAAIHLVPSPAGVGDPRFARRLGGLLRRLRPTHTHAHFGLDAYEALATAAALGVPGRFTTKHITPSPSRTSAVRHRLLAALVKAVFTVSSEVCDRLAALGVPARKLEVVHLGVDPGAYRPDPTAGDALRAELGLAPGTRLVVSTSHLRPGKGVELLPGLAAALAEQPDGVCVLVAGDGPLRAALEADARRLRLGADSIRLLGLREDVPRLLAAADVFVFPTVGSEGYPLGPLEALASARPVVASGVGDVGRSLAGAADIVAPGDERALVAACRRLLADPAGAEALGAAGRRLVTEQFSTQRAADRHVAVYLAHATRSRSRPRTRPTGGASTPRS
jgi:glycosyltransferase involved in cell wall biosynthesis